MLSAKSMCFLLLACSRAGLSSFLKPTRSPGPLAGPECSWQPQPLPKGTTSYLVFLTSACRFHPQGGPPRPADPSRSLPLLLLIPPGVPESATIQDHSLVCSFTPVSSHAPTSPDIQPSTESGFEHRFPPTSAVPFLIPSTPSSIR